MLIKTDLFFIEKWADLQTNLRHDDLISHFIATELVMYCYIVSIGREVFVIETHHSLGSRLASLRP